MSQSVMQQQIIPNISLNPVSWLRWWITPRNTDPDIAFRERVLRVTTFILTLFLLVIIPMILSDGTVEQEVTLFRLFTIFVGLAIVSTVGLLVHIRQYTLGAWILLSFLVLAMWNNANQLGAWTQFYTFYLVLFVLYSQLVLPLVHLRVSRVIVLMLAFIPQIVPTPFLDAIDAPESIISLFSPNSITFVLIFGIGIVMVILSYMRSEFDKRQVKLQEWADTLENQVTERTHELELARQEAEKARAEAEEANHTKSQFLANMSHELRTPLNAILNFTGFVADGVMGDVNNEQEDMLRQSINSGNHLLSLINDILDITKIEAGLMDLFIQPVDMNEVLGGVASVGKGLVKDKDIVFNIDIQENLSLTYGDKRRLRQVFLNVLSNAIKFTPQGSVSILAKSEANKICVTVQDTGIGIAPEDQSLIFQSFKQAKHDIHETIGTGLGMPISKYFVESHKGKIWLESEVGKGTTFHVELPILSEDEANQITLNVKEQA